jgi:hypothetical protein
MTTKRADSLPFSNPVMDSFELMKKMWGFAGLPGIPTPTGLASMAARIPQQLPSMLAPTLDVNELEKRIADLRTVEQWLELNASMLRTAIQSLEVQRATISTLKGITGAMMAPMRPKVDPSAAQPPEVALGLAAMKEDESKHALPPIEEPAPRAGRKTGGRASKQSTPPALAAAALNPLAWWNTLQDQFLRVSASAADAAAQGAASAKSPGTKPRRRASKSRKNRAS